METYMFINKDIKWCSHLLIDEQLCKILKLDLSLNPAIPQLGLYLKRKCKHTYIQKHVYE